MRAERREELLREAVGERDGHARCEPDRLDARDLTEARDELFDFIRRHRERVAAAVDDPTAQGAYNVADGDPVSTTAFMLEIAAAAGLPPPRFVSNSEAARHISPGMLAFLLESRRVDNRRLVSELGVRLRYPTAQAGILASLAEMRMEEARS